MTADRANPAVPSASPLARRFVLPSGLLLANRLAKAATSEALATAHSWSSEQFETL